MKSRITLNDKKRTHFKIYPTKDIVISDGEEFYNKLNSEQSSRHFIRSDKHKGYKIGVWTLDNYTILSMCLVNEFKTQNCSLWITPLSDLKDMLSCAKFLVDNYSTLIKDFKDQVTDNKKLLEDVKKERLTQDISA